MVDAENYIKNVEKMMKYELETGGEMQRAVQQHLGKIYNKEESLMYGSTYDDMMHRLERIMKGEKANHWEGQNKMSDMEKLRKKVIESNLREGW